MKTIITKDKYEIVLYNNSKEQLPVTYYFEGKFTCKKFSVTSNIKKFDFEISDFKGMGRRFEMKGEIDNVIFNQNINLENKILITYIKPNSKILIIFEK